MLLMSKHNLATSASVTIDFLDGYYREQVIADYVHDPKKWWEVIDRTTGDVVPASDWSVDQEKDLVTIGKLCRSMNTRCPSSYMPSGILHRCITTSPMTGETSLMTSPLMYARQIPGHLPKTT